MKTPYFIFYPSRLKKNYSNLEKLCKKHLKKFQICYSVKTNSNPDVLKTLNSINSGFELASEKEIKLTQPYKQFKIINGTAKTKQEIKSAINNNIRIIADSESEIKKISKTYNKLNPQKKKLEIGLRLSLKQNKFGIPIDKMQETIDFCKKNNLSVNLIHYHQGTQISFEKYKLGIEKFIRILEKLKQNIKFEYIDVGGSIPDSYRLKNLNKTLGDYIRIISKLNTFNSTIILEPGRFLVSDAFELITKIITIKQNENQIYAILDAGINILPKITLSKYQFSKLSNKHKSGNRSKKQNNKDYLLAGPLLFSNDILGKFQGNLNEGDKIRVENVGAYCYNLAWTISYNKPKVYIKH